jgi:adenine-specific DNA methylase
VATVRTKIGEVNKEGVKFQLPAISALEKKPSVVFVSRLALREGNSKKPIYQIHKWWARRLGSVFRSILIGATTPASKALQLPEELFYKRHDLSGCVVLDPFVGGGTSVVEAAKFNANVIGVDIDPVACFVTRKELEAAGEPGLKREFGAIARAVKSEILSYYRTKLPDGRTGTIIYAFWVQVIKCRNCKASTTAHPHFQLLRDRKRKKQIVFCRSCHAVHELSLRRTRFACSSCFAETVIHRGHTRAGKFACPDCASTATINSLISSKKPLPQKLFALEVLVDGTNERVFKKADAGDLVLFAKARRQWRRRARKRCLVPTELIPVKGRVDPRPVSLGYKRYRDLFNERQLLCLSLIAEAIARISSKRNREFLATAFSDSLAANNMFCFYAFDYQKLTPLFGLHAYHQIMRPVENNVWGSEAGRGSFAKCFAKLLRAKRYAKEPFEYRYGKTGRPKQIVTGECIKPRVYERIPRRARNQPFAVLLNRSSENLGVIRPKSVDLILTDPPYYDNLAYSELSDFYHVWLKRLGLRSYRGKKKSHAPMADSLYVDSRNGKVDKEHAEFVAGLQAVFSECRRVLKDSGLFAFTFHHGNNSAWAALGSALFVAGFKVTNVFPVRSEGQSRFHSAAGNLKWDVVFCCRKRPDGEVRSKNISIESASLAERAHRKSVEWKRILKRAKLEFSPADQLNLCNAIRVMQMCNADIDPGLMARTAA